MPGDGMTLRWNGRQFNRLLRHATATGLKRAAVFYHSRCRLAVSKPNTGTRRRRRRDTVAGKKGSQYTTYDHSSFAGQCPAGPHRSRDDPRRAD